MDRSAALRQLPEAYAEALCLRESGADNEAVAAFLEIPLEAVGPLFRIAEVKLAEILATEQAASGPP